MAGMTPARKYKVGKSSAEMGNEKRADVTKLKLRKAPKEEDGNTGEMKPPPKTTPFMPDRDGPVRKPVESPNLKTSEQVKSMKSSLASMTGRFTRK